jgi:hypothetical protein
MKLLEGGVLYPLTGCSGNAHYGVSNALGFSHEKLGLTDLRLTELASNLSREYDNSRAKACVISSENFILPKAIQPVKKLFSAFDCRVLVYLRRHDYWWESAYAQAVKMKSAPPWKSGIKSFINYNRKKNPNYLNYRFLVDRWANVFGEEKIIVRPYESIHNTSGVISDFFHTIGYPKLAEHSAAIDLRVNESASPAVLYVLNLLQRSEIETDIRNALIAKVIEDDWGGSEDRMLAPSFRRRLIEENQSDYDYIAGKYMGRSKEGLFSDPIPDLDEFWREPVNPDFSEVVSRLVTYMRDIKVKS